MKNKILALMFMVMLLATGCAVEADESFEENSESDDNIRGMIDICNEQADKILAIVLPILDYEANSASRLLVNNALDRIAQFNQRIKELEATLDELENADFAGKENYISKNRELVKVLKELVAEYGGLYNFDLELKEKDSIWEKKDKTDDLHNAIVNCRCGEFDCGAYMDSTLEYMEESVKIFTRIKEKYGLEAFGKAADEWAKDMEIAERHWPGLISKSESYGDRCYRINDAYSRYVSEFDSVERVTESEIEDALSRKWLLSLMNLAADLDELSVDIDSARAGVES